jgi:hypothetical protein
MKICIVGNDAHAIVASWLAKRAGHTVSLHHTQTPDLRRPYVLYESAALIQTLKKLSIAYSTYRINSGILLQGEVHPYPRIFRQLGKTRTQIIRTALWAKTRLIQATPYPWQSVDYDSSTTKVGVQFQWAEFVEEIYGKHSVAIGNSFTIRTDRIAYTNGAQAPFDLCLVTLPLWTCQDLVEWHLPHASAVALNTAIIDSNQVPGARDLMSGWDSVWTPYTPDNVVHRVFQIGDEYHVQFSGHWREGEVHPGLLGDLNYLFPSGWAPTGAYRGGPGYLCPLSEKPLWPKTVVPLGRLARWDSRATFAQTIDEVVKLVR